MMDEDFTSPVQARSSSVRGLVIFALICFAIGIAAMGWLLSEWTPARNMLLGKTLAPQTAISPPQSAPSAPVAPKPEAAATPEEHMAKIEEKLAIIDQQADSASNDASRAERMMIAFAARRAIERGASLGYLEGALMRQFGGNDANAVSTIIKGARAPVTLEQLEEGLDTAHVSLIAVGADAGWFSRIWQDMGSLAVIKRDGEDRISPDQRYDRARRALERDRVEMAIREVEALPGHADAKPWLDRARRYVQVRKALDRLEAITLAVSRSPTV
jgi:hypothetical protein